MDIVGEVKKLIEQPIIDGGYLLDEVLYVNEDGVNYLRVVIDKSGIIDVEDCVNVSRIINPLLDEKDLIEQSYVLDVCSKEKGCEYNEQ